MRYTLLFSLTFLLSFFLTSFVYAEIADSDYLQELEAEVDSYEAELQQKKEEYQTNCDGLCIYPPEAINSLISDCMSSITSRAIREVIRIL